MNFVTIIIAFVIAWLVVFFMLLPVGVTTDEEVQEGNASSAPDNAHIGKKFLFSFIIAIILTCLYFYLLENNYFGLINPNIR